MSRYRLPWPASLIIYKSKSNMKVRDIGFSLIDSRPNDSSPESRRRRGCAARPEAVHLNTFYSKPPIRSIAPRWQPRRTGVPELQLSCRARIAPWLVANLVPN
jgi:hypothetical protein